MHHTVRRLREKHRSEEGFTLIELLVVVVIIGILVAIAVPVYLNYRQGAADKSAQSDVRGAISAMEQYYTDNSNVYPASPGTKAATFDLTGPNSTVKVTLSSATTMIINVSASEYAICATNSGGNKYYKYRNSTGGSVVTVTKAIHDACSATAN